MSAKRVLPVLLLIVVAGGGAWWWQLRQQVPDHRLVLYGNVDVRQVDLAFTVEGKVVELLADEGDRVESGALIARLDSELYDHAVALTEARVASQAALVAKLEAGSRPAEITRARADVAQARARVANNEATFERKKALAASDFAARQSVDDSRAGVDTSKAELAARAADLALAEEGPRQEDIAAARAQLRAEQEALAVARYRLQETGLIAPATGTVLTRAREVGAVVGAGSTVLTLSIADPVWVRTYVDEPDLGRIHPGMAAVVTTDSHPDKIYEGSIGFISPTAEFTPKAVETPALRTALVYRVRVHVTNPDNGLRQGMPVTVTIASDDAGR